MFRTLVVAGAATLLMSVAGAPTATAATTWAMPSLQGMNLQSAQDLFTETVGNAGPKLQFINNALPSSGSIRSLSMWEVCRQSPSAGAKISAKSWTAVSANRSGKC